MTMYSDEPPLSAHSHASFTQKIEDERMQMVSHFFDQLPHALAVLTVPEGCLRYLNPPLLTFWQQPAESVLNKPLFEVRPALRPYLEPLFRQPFQPDTPRVAREVPMEGFDQNQPVIRYFDICLSPLCDAESQPIGQLLTCTDVTGNVQARQQAEQRATESKQQIEASERKFRHLMKASMMGIFFWDKDGRMVDANDTFLNMIGYSRQEMYGLDWQMLTPPQWKEADQEALEQLRTSGQHTPFEKQYLHKDLHPVDVIVGSTAFEGTDNHQGVTFVLDISQRKAAEEALEEQQRFSSSIVEAAPSLTYIYDMETTSNVFVSSQIQDILGYSPQDIRQTGSHLLTTLLHPEDLDAVRKRFEQLLSDQSGQIYAIEYRMRRSDDSYVWLYDRARVFRRNASGHPTQILGVANDITERKKAEEAIQESESRFRTLANDAPAFMFTADAHINVEFVNRHWLDFVGMDPATGLGWAWALVTHPDDLGPMKEVYLQSVRDRKPYQIHIRQKHQNGDYHWVLWHGIPRVTANGQFTGIIGVGLDVTEQKLAQEKLHESEHQLRILAETLPQMIWVSDAAGKTQYYSARWTEYSGIADLEEAWHYMIHPEEKEMSTLAYQQAYQNGQPFRYELRLRNRQGQYRWHLSVAEPVRDSAGHIVRWVGALSDIHDQKALAESLEKIVSKRTEELVHVNEELVQSNQALEQFAYVASHDLQEPLRKITTFSRMLIQQYASALDEPGRHLLERSEVAAGRMRALIESLLAYSRIGRNPKETFALIDLNEILRLVLSELEIRITEQAAQIQVDPLPVLYGEPSQMGRLFTNLLSNGLKFTRSGVTPLIRLHAWTATEAEKASLGLPVERAYTCIRVSDNGIGFDQTYAQHIFEPFRRLHSQQEYAGSGVGLAICRRIVENHSGAIYAQGQPGQGAVFTVLLPLELNSGQA